MTTTTRKRTTTTAKSLGWVHQQARAALMRKHSDGAKCEWCGRPMYGDANRHKNFDYKAGSTNPDSGKLHADHSKMSRAEALRLGLPVPRADRLLHGACNIQRGDGGNDHLAVGAGGVAIKTEQLVMAWPWRSA